MPAACCGGENIQGRSQLVAPGGAGRRPEAVLTDLATTYRPATTCRPAGAARRPGGALALLEIVTSFTDCYRSGPEHRQEDPLSSEDLAAARRYIAEERKIRRDDHLVYPLGYEMPTAIELTERAVLIRRGDCRHLHLEPVPVLGPHRAAWRRATGDAAADDQAAGNGANTADKTADDGPTEG